MYHSLNVSYIAIIKYPKGTDYEYEKTVLETGFKYTAELIKDGVENYTYLANEQRKLYLHTLSAKNLLSRRLHDAYLFGAVAQSILANNNLITPIGEYILLYANCRGMVSYFRYIIDTYLSRKNLEYCLGVIDSTKLVVSYGLYRGTDAEEDFFDVDSKIDFLDTTLERFNDPNLCSYCKNICDVIGI